MTKGAPLQRSGGAFAGTSSGVQNTVGLRRPTHPPRQLAPGHPDFRWKLASLRAVWIRSTLTARTGSVRRPFLRECNRPYTIIPPGTGQILKIGGGYAEFSGAICDVAIWNNLLTGETQSHGTGEGETAALYNVPMYNGHSGAPSQYDASVMNQLFNLYAKGHPATTLPITTSNGTLTWQYVASGLPGARQRRSTAQRGVLCSTRPARRNRRPGTVVPEPGTLALRPPDSPPCSSCAWRRRR